MRRSGRIHRTRDGNNHAMPDEHSGRLGAASSTHTDTATHSPMPAPITRSHEPEGVPARRVRAIAGYPVMAGCVIVLGTLLRLRQWWPGRSLWFDELELAFNLRDRSFAKLLQPLDQGQAAPVGWLWLERLAVVLNGTGERTLRLVPLLFGVGLLVVLAWAAGLVLRTPAALAVLVLAAAQQYLVYYSNELKQYSSEAFWVTVLVALGLVLVRRPPTARHAALYWAVALLGATMSMMALPVAGVIGAIVTIQALRHPAGRVRAALRFALPGGVWLAGALALYLTTMRSTQNSAYFKHYWAGAFPSRPLVDIPATLHWVGHIGNTLFGIPFDVRFSWAFVLLLLIGAVRCVRRSGVAVLAVLLAPALIGIGAAAVSVYPFLGRLALYSMPSILLLPGYAVDGPYPRIMPASWPTRLGAARVLLAGVLLLAVAVPWADTAVAQARRPVNPVGYRQALAYIAAHRQAGDALVGASMSDRPQRWYGPHLLGLHNVVILLAGRTADGCRPDAVAKVLRGHQRVWLFELIDWQEPTNPVLQARLQQFGRQVEVRLFPGTRVVLYDLTQAPGGPVDEHRYLSPTGYDCLKVIA